MQVLWSIGRQHPQVGPGCGPPPASANARAPETPDLDRTSTARATFRAASPSPRAVPTARARPRHLGTRPPIMVKLLASALGAGLLLPSAAYADCPHAASPTCTLGDILTNTSETDAWTVDLPAGMVATLTVTDT